MIPKFRAYDLNEKEWIDIRYIGLSDDGSLWYVQAWDECERDIDPPYFEEDLGKTWALMQSTGLLDKNGKEIFEGDIIKHDPVPNPFISNKYFEVIQARSGEWRMDNYRGGQVLAFGNHEVEVIGNKFQNKHLLEEE